MSFTHRVLQRVMGLVARFVCACPGLIHIFGVLFAATYNLFACDWIAEKVV